MIYGWKNNNFLIYKNNDKLKQCFILNCIPFIIPAIKFASIIVVWMSGSVDVKDSELKIYDKSRMDKRVE